VRRRRCRSSPKSSPPATAGRAGGCASPAGGSTRWRR